MTARILIFLIVALLSSCKSKSQLKDLTTNSENLPTNQNWESLFNGKDLANWRVACSEEDRSREYWSVVDDAIVANSMGHKDHGYVWLISQKEYADFELRLKFQSYRDSPGNSGVQVRSRYDALAKVEGEKGLGYLDGPQVDIHPPGAWRTGYIYDETRGHRRWISPSLPDWRMDKDKYAPDEHVHYFSDEAPYWNELTVICNGNNIKTIVNGITVSDYDGTGILDDIHHQKADIDKKGYIALQLHKDDEIKIAFKDILINTL